MSQNEGCRWLRSLGRELQWPTVVVVVVTSVAPSAIVDDRLLLLGLLVAGRQ